MIAPAGGEGNGQKTGVLGCYVRFTGLGLLVAILLTAVGYFPTTRWAGHTGVVAMLAGCGVSFVASAAGAIPVARALGREGSEATTAILLATGVRFVSVLALVVPLALSGWVERTAFVVWVGISYLVMLLVDSLVAVRALDGASRHGE